MPFNLGGLRFFVFRSENRALFSPLRCARHFQTLCPRSGSVPSVQRVMVSSSPQPNLGSRFRGCLLGGAVGDALGAPVEFLSLAEIRAQFGPAGITDYAPAYGGLGRITDDTQMTLFTAEGLLRARVRGTRKGTTTNTGVVGHALVRWLKTQGVQPHADLAVTGDAKWPDGWLVQQRELWSRRAPGNTCLSALAAATAFGSRAHNDSKGCGGVMRVAPAGLLASAATNNPFMPTDEELSPAFALGRDLSHATHGHRASLLASGAMAHLVALLVAGTPLRQAIVQTNDAVSKLAGAEALRGRFQLAVDLGLQPGEGTAEEVETIGAGWVAEEALAIALYVALKAKSFEHGLQLAVNHGGDSDSTGSMVGQLLGAAWGIEVIPTRWLDRLELRSVIQQLADDLEAVAKGTFDAEAQWERYPGW